jgi:flagellar basal body P-ring formation protein FlgA
MRALLFLALLPAAGLADELVATRNLPAGTILSAGDVTVSPSQRPGVALPDALGRQLRTAAYAGRPIPAGQLTTPRLVSRNQLVTLAYENAALRIETGGRALGEGSEGDVIRVMNLSSRATLMARINADGSVTVAQR